MEPQKTLSKTLHDKLKKLQPDKTLLVKINTDNLNQVEKDLLIFDIAYQMAPDCTGYFAEMNARQILHFSEYLYIKSMDTSFGIDSIQ